jgi:lysozyme
MREINEAGLKLIESFEGLRLKAYNDGVGVMTIGYGHTDGVKRGDVITKAQAEEYLKEDLADAIHGVEKAVKVDLSDNEFAACVSLAFNIGTGGFAKSSVCRLVNRQKYDEAADAFLLWNKGGGKVMPGLTRRRQAERKLFLTPDEEAHTLTTSPDNDPPATPQTEQGAGSEAPGPTSPQAEAKVVVAAQPEKSGALKSLWVTISGTVLAVLAWIWANIEKIFGIVKDNQIDVTTVTKWAFIAIGGVVSMYLFRQLVLDAIRIASSTFLTHTEAQIAANPDLHDVKIASPAPKEGDA